jgi:hypothetical protein
MLADDENLHRRKLCLDRFRHLQAIHSRHGDVEEHNVGLMFSDFADRILPIHRLANNFDISLRTQNMGYAAPDALIVIYDEHT